MDKSKPFVITISRQIGSGGAYIGKQLASKLNIYYADRDILTKAAKEFSVMEKDLEVREEKLQSFWESFFQIRNYATDPYLNSVLLQPTTYELFQIESQIMQRIAKEQSAVIIGRCGFHIFRNNPNCVSVYLHADKDFRNKRIQDLYQISEKDAFEMIARVDKERAQFVEEYTGEKWSNANQFDLSLNTGKIGIDASVELIAQYIDSIK